MPGTRLFPRTNYQVLRGFSELLTEHTLTRAEWRTIKEFFARRCAFCDVEDTGNPRTGLVPDHLVAAKNLGAFCIGNVVPACHDCNDQRGKMDWRDYLHQYRPAEALPRIAKIEAYLSAFPYTAPTDPHERLTSPEKIDYLKLLADWDALWKRARDLRHRIRNRRAQERNRA